MKTPTYAELASKIKSEVEKFLKVLNDPGSTKLQKHTAELNLQSRQILLDKLSGMQEQQKRRMQIASPGQMPMGNALPQGMEQEGEPQDQDGQFPWGGYNPPKYTYGVYRPQVGKELFEFGNNPTTGYQRGTMAPPPAYVDSLPPQVKQAMMNQQMWDAEKGIPYPNWNKKTGKWDNLPPGHTQDMWEHNGSSNPKFIGPSGVLPLQAQVSTNGNIGLNPFGDPNRTMPGTDGTTGSFIQAKFKPVDFNGTIPQPTNIPPDWSQLAPAAANLGAGIFGKPDYLNAADYMIQGHKDPLELDVRPEMQDIRTSDITNRRRVSNMSPAQIAAAQVGSGDWKAKATERIGRMKNEYDTNQISSADQINLGLNQENMAIKRSVDDENRMITARKQQMLGTGAQQVAEFGTNTRNDKLLQDQMYKEQMNAYNNLKFQSDVFNSQGQWLADSQNADYQNMWNMRKMGVDALKPLDGLPSDKLDVTPKEEEQMSMTKEELSAILQGKEKTYPANANDKDREVIDRNWEIMQAWRKKRAASGGSAPTPQTTTPPPAPGVVPQKMGIDWGAVGGNAAGAAAVYGGQKWYQMLKKQGKLDPNYIVKNYGGARYDLEGNPINPAVAEAATPGAIKPNGEVPPVQNWPFGSNPQTPPDPTRVGPYQEPMPGQKPGFRPPIGMGKASYPPIAEVPVEKGSVASWPGSKYTPEARPPLKYWKANANGMSPVNPPAANSKVAKFDEAINSLKKSIQTGGGQDNLVPKPAVQELNTTTTPANPRSVGKVSKGFGAARGSRTTFKSSGVVALGIAIDFLGSIGRDKETMQEMLKKYPGATESDIRNWAGEQQKRAAKGLPITNFEDTYL